MLRSRDPNIAGIIERIVLHPGNSTKAYLSKRIVDDVNKMIEKFEGTEMHYVRCVKSTNKLKPNDFDDNLVSQQVRDLGIAANARLNKSTYITHIPYESFCIR